MIILKTKIKNDEYTEYVYRTFDIQNSEESIIEIPNKIQDLNCFDWNIGIIYGQSGSGKSTILSSLGVIKEPKFDDELPLISNFTWLSPNEAAMLLSSIGLASVPTWLRPYKLLSNGEKYRAVLGYLISSARENEIILVDEFTSVVDRDVAKAMSFSIQKYIRREKKKVILASCHYDIFDWLMPDWSYSLQNGGVFERHECRRQSRPQIELSVYRAKPKSWDIFKKHHYLTSSANKSYIYVLFVMGNKPIAIAVIGQQIGKGVNNSLRDSRIVVLPEYQGLNIGTSISNFIGGVCKSIGFKYFTKTAHPALGKWRNKRIDLWKPTAYNCKVRKDKNYKNKWSSLKKRFSYCHEYIGPPIYGYEKLLDKVDVVKNEYISKVQYNLF